MNSILIGLDPRSQDPEFHASIIDLMTVMIPRFIQTLIMPSRSGTDRK